MGKNIEFTDKELDILHAIVVKEKSGLEHMNHRTIMGKESLDNYSKDLADLQLKIEDVKKEKISILIVTNTVKQATIKANDFIEEIGKNIEDFELGKKGIMRVVKDSCEDLSFVSPVGLKVKYDKFYKRINIKVENDDEVKEILIKFMGSQQMYDGMRFDAAFIDYGTFYNRSLLYNDATSKQISELEQKLEYTLIHSKYYEKELPKLVKVLLD